ncbi:glycosyl transferase family 10 (putative fucosyltransferase) [Limnobacter thiooxidans]|uniref:Glycosyltransferase family 10 n=1 Tax=Limnobacter thiooxidans TaxID=131080 RepID=A0AA86MAF0_9BURK|nr:glycosyl transferase family 10 (putative fucosyltransferase) [Limnobacter thiooxidans]BET24733.1 glycosyltransferase family 10 [Limnobacter thiooxidans]
MKKISFINTHEAINVGNRLFESETYELGDGLLTPFTEMRDAARLDGYDFATYHLNPLETSNAVVCLDMPSVALQARIAKLSVPKYLFIFECPLIRPDDWESSQHAIFDRVFTYDRTRWRGGKYLNYAMPYSMRRTIVQSPKTRFMCLVASNKVILRQRSGYDDRRDLIEYFRKTKMQGFDLYGRGWEFYVSASRLLNRLFARFGSKAPWLRRFCTALPFYQGALVNKLQTISQYKFIYCNENFSHPGYLTEKILDAMWAGSVPVYSGPPDIDDFIPQNCYVAAHDFPSVRALVDHLSTMSSAQYMDYLTNIQRFLESEKAHVFSSDSFYAGLKSVLDEDL